MSKITAGSLIEQRARVLAMVQFTSRRDLQVSDLPIEGGLDLLVRIISEGPGYQKFFGVELKGTNRPIPDAVRATKYLRNSKLVKKFEGNLTPKYSFPVIVLLFSMQDDRGYFAWSIEPHVNRAGEPKLRLHQSPTCDVFDRAALGNIVERVNEWYDSLVALLEMA
jgi:hypothetical protein